MIGHDGGATLRLWKDQAAPEGNANPRQVLLRAILLIGLIVGIHLYNQVHSVESAAFQLVAGLFLMVPLLVLRPPAMSQVEKRLSILTLTVATLVLVVALLVYLLGPWREPDFKDVNDLVLGVVFGASLAIFAEVLAWATDDMP